MKKHSIIPHALKGAKCHKCSCRARWYVGFRDFPSNSHVVRSVCKRHAWYSTAWITTIHPESIIRVQYLALEYAEATTLLQLVQTRVPCISAVVEDVPSAVMSEPVVKKPWQNPFAVGEDEPEQVGA